MLTSQVHSIFEIELKNIILVALRVFEFSHSLDPKWTPLFESERLPERAGCQCEGRG
jgi:hypothetical protein